MELVLLISTIIFVLSILFLFYRKLKKSKDEVNKLFL